MHANSSARILSCLLKTLLRKANAKDISGLNDLKRVPQMEQNIVAAARKVGANACAQ